MLTPLYTGNMFKRFINVFLLSSIAMLFLTPSANAAGTKTITRGQSAIINWNVTGAPSCSPDTTYPNDAGDSVYSLWSGAGNNTTGSVTFSNVYSVNTSGWVFSCVDLNSGISDSARLIVNDCTAPQVWNGTACAAPAPAPKPDLTAGAPTPATATVGTQVTFTSAIVNSGGASTGNSFHNFFQFSTDGLATIQDGAFQFMSTLASGASQNATWSPTPSAPGTFYTRACADKQNRDSLGTVDESDENNNCGPWTTVTISCPNGTAWNGTTCAVTSSPSATLTVPSCTIASGASTCMSSISWTSANLTTTLSVRQNGSQFSTSATSAGLTRTLQYGSGAANVFTAVHNGSTLDTKTGTASCASGSTWDGSTCAASAPPVSSFIDIFFN